MLTKSKIWGADDVIHALRYLLKDHHYRVLSLNGAVYIAGLRRSLLLTTCILFILSLSKHSRTEAFYSFVNNVTAMVISMYQGWIVPACIIIHVVLTTIIVIILFYLFNYLIDAYLTLIRQRTPARLLLHFQKNTLGVKSWPCMIS
jgi:uncharacterized membrane protein YciS (DUF1049 family)